MNQIIAVTKEPSWMKLVGCLCLLPAVIALVPFKADYIQAWDAPFLVIGLIGVIFLVRASQKIGWRLNLEDNVLYYSKFNLFSSWKKRRSQEFALSVDKMTNVAFNGNYLTISYNPSKRLYFNVKGISSYSQSRLDTLKVQLDSKIKANHA
jgi:hypothetical protein